MRSVRAGVAKLGGIGALALAALVGDDGVARAQWPIYAGIGYGYRGYNAPNVYSGAGVGYGYTGINSPNIYSGVSSGVTGYPLPNLSYSGSPFYGGAPGVSVGRGGYYGGGYSGPYGVGYPGAVGYPGFYGAGFGYSAYSSYSYGLPGVAPLGVGIGTVGVGLPYGGYVGYGVPW